MTQARPSGSLRAQIDEGETLRLLDDLVRIPSPTAGEEKIAAFLEAYLRDAGFADVRRDVHHNVLLALRGKTPGRATMFLTHLDSGGAGSMADPYAPRVEPGDAFGKKGTVVRGLGACAPKSAVAAMVGAARAVARLGLPERRRIYVAAVTKDMQANHQGPRELFESFDPDVDRVIAGEPSGNRIVIGARGVNQVRIRLTGRPTHWGRPTEGTNPLFALGDVLIDLEHMALPSDPVLGSATIAPFEVRSDASPPRTPESVEVLVDRRTLPGENTADVVQDLTALVRRAAERHPGVGYTVELVRAMHSWRTDPDDLLVREIQATVTAGLGAPLETTYITFASNAGYAIGERHLPGVAIGPGNIGDIGPNEHVETAAVIEAARIYASIMEAA
jgi:acetylornithine deacetylase/succinyl-diaminopimelate desuccinylase-like protein